MKKFLVILMVIAVASFLFVGCLGVTPDVDVVVTLAAIPGVTAPVTGATPVTAITATAQYTGVVTWLPVATTFAGETIYTATITLTAKTGYTLTGVAANFFTVAEATSDTNPINSGVVTAEFPATAAAVAVIDIAAIPGVTAPVTGATPVTAITATAQYTGVVTWLPVATTFAAETIYTATITLTAKTGYTLTGVAANFFTVADATTDTNPIDSGVVTAEFPATAEVPPSDPPVMTDVRDSAGDSIFDVTSTATLYMNAAEADTSILVTGTNAPSGSSVQIYLDDVAIAGAMGEASVTGSWSVAVAESSLGDDGVGKVLHATATEVGLAESAASNSVTFTLDTLKPSATTLAATAETAAEDGDAEEADDGTAVAAIVIDDEGDVEDGTWVIDVLGITGALNNVIITGPDFERTYTGVPGNQVFAANAPIPGVEFTLVAALDVGLRSEIECTATVDAIVGRARVLFSEEVTSASAVDIDNYIFTVLADNVTPDDDGTYHDKYAYFNDFTLAVDQYDTLNCEVNGAEDLAGNIQTTASYISCTVAEEDETSLAP